MKKRIILISILASVSIVVIAIIRVKTNEPPFEEINLARKIISEAELVRSSRYAQEHYLSAAEYYDSAMLEWSRENEKFILFRNYKRIGELAKLSSESSGKAIATTKKNIKNVEDELEIRIYKLGERIKDFDNKFGCFPINSMHRDEIIKSKLQYSEGVLAFKNKNYSICKSKLDSVETAINQVFVLYEEKFNSYLNEYPLWSDLVEKTIKFSKRNKSYAIVVDKLARECIIYKDGEAVNKYTVELGSNWIGNKKQQDDKSTPEGLYKITDKKSKGQTRYYKALLLDYPNDEDKKLFLQNKKDGLVTPEAKIGNQIEIHGHGGKGIDWTDGCIALKDADIDIVFKFCPLRTRVVIVGSTKSLNELLVN